MYCITKWTKHVTDDGRDHYTGREKAMRERLADVVQRPVPLYEFRLLDDDGLVYAYGLSTENDTEDAFRPLDRYQADYGVTEIQYKDPVTGAWETL